MGMLDRMRRVCTPLEAGRAGAYSGTLTSFIIGAALASASASIAADGAGAEAAYVAGTAPHQRPADAPVLKKFQQTDAWRARALTGVTEPIPSSLKFLNDQGGWFNPFTKPGMPGVYDIRGFHRATGAAAPSPISQSK